MEVLWPTIYSVLATVCINYLYEDKNGITCISLQRDVKSGKWCTITCNSGIKRCLSRRLSLDKCGHYAKRHKLFQRFQNIPATNLTDEYFTLMLPPLGDVTSIDGLLPRPVTNLTLEILPSGPRTSMTLQVDDPLAVTLARILGSVHPFPPFRLVDRVYKNGSEGSKEQSNDAHLSNRTEGKERVDEANKMKNRAVKEADEEYKGEFKDTVQPTNNFMNSQKAQKVSNDYEGFQNSSEGIKNEQIEDENKENVVGDADKDSKDKNKNEDKDDEVDHTDSDGKVNSSDDNKLGSDFNLMDNLEGAVKVEDNLESSSNVESDLGGSAKGLYNRQDEIEGEEENLRDRNEEINSPESEDDMDDDLEGIPEVENGQEEAEDDNINNDLENDSNLKTPLDDSEGDSDRGKNKQTGNSKSLEDFETDVKVKGDFKGADPGVFYDEENDDEAGRDKAEPEAGHDDDEAGHDDKAGHDKAEPEAVHGENDDNPEAVFGEKDDHEVVHDEDDDLEVNSDDEEDPEVVYDEDDYPEVDPDGEDEPEAVYDEDDDPEVVYDEEDPEPHPDGEDKSETVYEEEDDTEAVYDLEVNSNEEDDPEDVYDDENSPQAGDGGNDDDEEEQEEEEGNLGFVYDEENDPGTVDDEDDLEDALSKENGSEAVHDEKDVNQEDVFWEKDNFAEEVDLEGVHNDDKVEDEEEDIELEAATDSQKSKADGLDAATLRQKSEPKEKENPKGPQNKANNSEGEKGDPELDTQGENVASDLEGTVVLDEQDKDKQDSQSLDQNKEFHNNNSVTQSSPENNRRKANADSHTKSVKAEKETENQREPQVSVTLKSANSIDQNLGRSPEWEWDKTYESSEFVTITISYKLIILITAVSTCTFTALLVCLLFCGCCKLRPVCASDNAV